MRAFYALLLLVLCELLLQTRTVVSSSKSKTDSALWRERVSVALRFMRTQPCWRFLSPVNCPDVSGIPEPNMNVYIAKKSRNDDKLVATLPEKRHHSLLPSNVRLHDAVIAIDPYPKASFGHLVFIFFVEENSSPGKCSKHGNGRLTVTGDCIRAANKSYCQNNVDERQRKKCWVNFLPLVYSQSDSVRKTQRLECVDGMRSFGKCRQMITSQMSTTCGNSQRCSSNAPKVPKSCWNKCDYAVMVSGGWNTQTALPHHAKNLQVFWQFLRQHKFNKKRITTFYGSDGAVELDGDRLTKDASPALTESSIRRHINKLCDAAGCVDSLVIYLTGPAHSNGALLLWDANGDGLTENAEKYNVKEIFEDLEYCNAKRVFIVADYSYSGHLAHRLQKYRNENKKGYSHITVLTSSQSNQYAWGSEFTKALLKYGVQNNTICMDSLLQDVKRDFRHRNIPSSPVLAEGSRLAANTTVCGNSCGIARSTIHACTITPISELGKAKQRKRNSRRKLKKRTS